MILSEFLSRFDSGEVIGLIALAGGMAVGLVLGIMGILLVFYTQRLKYRRVEILAALKQDMLNRGMSADEICMVLETGTRCTRESLAGQHSCGLDRVGDDCFRSSISVLRTMVLPRPFPPAGSRTVPSDPSIKS
jgi:hypothetical protein